MNFANFSATMESGLVLKEWHKGLENRKGDRAMLKRANGSVEASFIPYAYDLVFGLKKVNATIRPDRLLAIASVLVFIKEPVTGNGLAAQLAAKREGSDQPVFSELRFRRLLQSEDRESLCRALRRAIAMLDGKADIHSTANAIYWWNDRQRREWANVYFGKLAGLAQINDK